jgi:hypothetical protein
MPTGYLPNTPIVHSNSRNTLQSQAMQLGRMAFAVLQNEIPDPEQIRPYCAMAVALDTHDVLNGLEKRRFRHVLHLIHEMYADRYTRWVT